ncbi:MAG: hypothetical protein U1F45_02085 [Burkholderiales bacterium]
MERLIDGGFSWAPVVNTLNYTLGDADVGTHVRVTVSYTDGSGASRRAPARWPARWRNVNDAPVVVVAGGTVAYTENDPATPVDPALTVSDIDTATPGGRHGAHHGRCGVAPGGPVTFTAAGGITGAERRYRRRTSTAPRRFADWQTVLVPGRLSPEPRARTLPACARSSLRGERRHGELRAGRAHGERRAGRRRRRPARAARSR